MTEPFSLERIVHSVAEVAGKVTTTDTHLIRRLVDELDLLAEELVGRHDEPSVAQKIEVQRLVRELCPARSAFPPAVTR